MTSRAVLVTMALVSTAIVVSQTDEHRNMCEIFSEEVSSTKRYHQIRSHEEETDERVRERIEEDYRMELVMSCEEWQIYCRDFKEEDFDDDRYQQQQFREAKETCSRK